MMPDGYPFTMTLRVLCEKGTVEFTFRAGGTGVETGSGSGTSLIIYETGVEPRPLPAPDGDAFEAEVAYFVECVRQERFPDRSTPEQGRLAVKTALAAREALETDRVISF
jgi:predicted dehydrogenase